MLTRSRLAGGTRNGEKQVDAVAHVTNIDWRTAGKHTISLFSLLNYFLLRYLPGAPLFLLYHCVP